MNKLTVKLKQHSPLIHFQHDQEGATLRASEVKPKLDKFLIKYAFGGDFEKCKTHLIGYSLKEENRIRIKFNEGKAGLNYKMRIWVDGNIAPSKYMIVSSIGNDDKITLEKNGIDIIPNSPYFAQEEKKASIVKDPSKWDLIEKKGILHESVNLVISCCNNNLIQEIKNNLQAFFLVNNFGTRQSKGFGSFEAIEIKMNVEKALELFNNINILKEKYLFVYKKQLNSPTLTQIFEQINDDYKFLKSGRRIPYARSKMMLYGLRENMRWDKKFLKEKINNRFETETGDDYELKGRFWECSREEEDDYENYGRYYLRALLGLAEQYEFLLKNPAVVKGKNKMIVKMKNTAGIQRIKSPITFKVLDDCIYIVGNNVSHSILGKNFTLSITVQGDPEWNNYDLEDRIRIPDTFSLPSFMKFAMKNYGNNKDLGYTAIKE